MGYIDTNISGSGEIVKEQDGPGGKSQKSTATEEHQNQLSQLYDQLDTYLQRKKLGYSEEDRIRDIQGQISGMMSSSWRHSIWEMIVGTAMWA